MPELTEQDRDRYDNLYGAAEKLFKAIPENNINIKIVPSFTLKELTSAFFHKLLPPKDLANFEELQSQVELTGGYLTMDQLFVEAIETLKDMSAKTAINQARQKLLIEYTQLKVSLEAVDEDFLDDVKTSCSDPLFLGLLTDPNVKKWTNEILSDCTPILDDSQVQGLINAWGTAVAAFAEDARNNKPNSTVDPGETETIAHFFCIHDQLEGLYSELSTAVALNS